MTQETLSRSRVPNVRRKTAPAFHFVPVIFANGEDDDAPGLVAMIEDKEVQYGETIYQPGESLSVVGRNLVIGAPQFTVRDADGNQVLFNPHAPPECGVIAVRPESPRFIEICDNTIHMGRRK